MTDWCDGPMLAFDTETTGVDVENDRIVTISLVQIRPGASPQQRTGVIDPGIPIPDAAAAIHGWTTERVRREGREPPEVLQHFTDRIVGVMVRGVPLVGANLCYDLTLLDRELRRHNLVPPQARPQFVGHAFAPVVDCMVLDKQVSTRRGRRRLTDLCEHYKVRIDRAHDSAADAIAAARVAWKIAKQHPQIGSMPLADLHQAQIGWRRQQCDGLRRHFDANGITHDGVPGDWPMIPYKDVEQLEMF